MEADTDVIEEAISISSVCLPVTNVVTVTVDAVWSIHWREIEQAYAHVELLMDWVALIEVDEVECILSEAGTASSSFDQLGWRKSNWRRLTGCSRVAINLTKE